MRAKLTQYKSPMELLERRKRLLGIMLFVVAGIVATLLGYAYWLGRQEAIPLDEATLCPSERPPSAYYSILIDTTDPFTPIQRASIHRYLSELRNRIPDYAHISVFALSDPAERIPKPLVSLCNPGTGSDANELIQNPLLLEQRWESRFRVPLDEIFDRIVRDISAATSPIMEMIQAVAITSFPTSMLPKHLVIVSDMLQNTNDYSHYNSGAIEFGQFRQLPYFDRVYTNLSGVDVSILYAKRHDPTSRHVQKRRHIDFWEAYFRELGGRLIHVQRMEG